jgi:hypothetical protein
VAFRKSAGRGNVFARNKDRGLTESVNDFSYPFRMISLETVPRCATPKRPGLEGWDLTANDVLLVWFSSFTGLALCKLGLKRSPFFVG